MIYYTQEQMQSDLLSIIRQMEKENFRPDYIAGIVRGGLIPATMLAQWYECPVLTVHCSLRDHNEAVEVDEMISIPPGSNVLLVDDIIDTGETLHKIKEKFSARTSNEHWDRHIKVAALWHNISQDFDPNFAGRWISRAEDKRWIVFPYENWWESK